MAENATLRFTGPPVVEGEFTPGLVSVVIPTYERAEDVRQAIESILAQTYDRIEVIVVDDGSTDSTQLVVEAFGSPVRYLYQPNSGVSAARNRGLAACRGEYVGLLDSDDRWVPWKIAAQVEILKHFPQVGMVWTDMTAVDAKGACLNPAYLRVMYEIHAETHIEEKCDGCRLSEIWPGAPSEVRDATVLRGNIFSSMLLGNHVHTSTVLVRRSRLARTGGFDESLEVSGEDYEFHLRTCAAGDVALLDIPSALYRIGADDQLTAPRNLVHIAHNNLVTVTRWLEAAPDGSVLDAARIKQRLAECHTWIGEEEFRRGNMRAARKHLLAGLRRRPIDVRRVKFLMLTATPRALALGALKLRRRLLKRPVTAR